MNKALQLIKQRLQHTRQQSTQHIPIYSDSDNLRIGSLISTTEQQYINQRKQLYKRTIKPTVGLAFSGGGYRSLIATSQILNTLESNNLVQYIDYISATSGSAWYFSNLYSHNTVHPNCHTTPQHNKYYQHIHNVLRGILTAQHLISTKTLDYRIALNNIIHAYKTNKSLSVIELLSYGLDATFFNNTYIDFHTSHNTALQYNTLPYPIYNMVDSLNQLYYNVTPHEFQCIDLHCSIPTQYLNYTYNNGQLQHSEYQSLHTLSLVLTICGSAFCVDVNRMLNELKYHIPSTYLNVLHYMTSNTRMLTSQLIESYKLSNMLYNIDNEHINKFGHYATKAKELSILPHIAVSDAGNMCNIPFHTLLHRKCDIILCVDNSSPPEIYDAYALKQMYVYAKQHNIQLPELSDSNTQFIQASDNCYKSLLRGNLIDLDQHFDTQQLQLIQQISSSVCTIIHGNMTQNVPTIVYIPLIKNDKYDNTYDPRLLCIQREHLQTFNLQYTVEQFDKLSELVDFNISTILQEIKHMFDTA